MTMGLSTRKAAYGFRFFLFLAHLAAICATARADVENQFNADVRIMGAAVQYAEDSYYRLTGTGGGYDAQTALRLKDRLFFTDQLYLELHYEIYGNGGDTYKKNQHLKDYFASLSAIDPAGSGTDDSRRLFDLTATIEETDDYAISHRLDRMLISATPQWGEVTVGRQAVTWGNGLIFNPMDLFNPFAPSDTIRDYKVGDDLLSVRFNSGALGEFNFLLVPRRNEENDVDRKCSSLAGKTHLFLGNTELDMMLARHYEESVVGVGISGYISDATYRGDVVWSTLSDGGAESDFFNLVFNLDYSWVFWGKNMYGLVEYFHSGLGKEHYPSALLSPEVAKRLERGELFTLGEDYVAGQIQIELHPLLNFYLSVISNISDPSGIIQPRGIFSVSQQATLSVGATTYYGKKESEFGGFSIPGSEIIGEKVYTTSPQNLYLLLTLYF